MKSWTRRDPELSHAGLGWVDFKGVGSLPGSGTPLGLWIFMPAEVSGICCLEHSAH